MVLESLILWLRNQHHQKIIKVIRAKHPLVVLKNIKNLAKFIETEKPQNVAIPKLATGVGGLEWNEVRQSIYKYLDALDTPVFLYTTYNKGIKAQEG